MSDPYNTPLGEDPQSVAILQERRFLASSYRRQELQQSELHQAEHKWGRTSLPPLIRSALSDYFENKDKRHDDLNRDGELQGFLLSQVLAGLWLTAGPNLRKNILGGSIEFYGEVKSEKTIQADVRAKGWRYGRLPSYDEIETYAEEFAYSPVKGYLNSLPIRTDKEESWWVLNQLGSVALGLTDDLAIEMVSRTLIGAAARAMVPGCKQQTCLVLQGKQGAMKSTFFEVLFGSDFFTTLDGHEKPKDWVTSMEKVWCAELAELESFTSKKAAGAMKNFLSTATDTFRRPYDKHATTIKRHTICVASVNEGCPLVDVTGNRRFWMVAVPGSIDLRWVKANRDELWSAALHLYQEGEPWWFEGEMEELSMERADEFRQADPWEEALDELLGVLLGVAEPGSIGERAREFGFSFDVSKQFLTTSVILEALGVPIPNQQRFHSSRLGSLMRAKGWTNSTGNRDTPDGDRVSKKEWKPPTSST